MGKTRIILISLSILTLAGILFVIFLNRSFTGRVIQEEDKYTHSYTKAICNKTNYCQDYEVICKDNEVIDIKPIKGAGVQYPQDWKDPRDKETRDRLCG